MPPTIVRDPRHVELMIQRAFWRVGALVGIDILLHVAEFVRRFFV